MADDGSAPLRATSWAVLGLLSFGEELSGYDLKKWADWSLRFFYWAPSFSQIYGELHKLEALGLVSSRIVDKNDVRGKRLYLITAAGKDAVATWANDAPPDPAVLKHGIMLRMWLGHMAEPEKLREALLAHREQSEQMRVRALAHVEGAKTNPNWVYPEIVLNWSAQYYADECARADTMLADLDRLAEQRSGELPARQPQAGR
ncbi:PadR family transcriptional regulator [Mycobacterium sp.]|uniref:PadR family transcriptional regulator n=1 Tax=Mycobacterium sp. TaxID=1785 RepID=UPI003BA96642